MQISGYTHTEQEQGERETEEANKCTLKYLALNRAVCCEFILNSKFMKNVFAPNFWVCIQSVCVCVFACFVMCIECNGAGLRDSAYYI